MAAADAFASGCGSYESRVSIWDRSAVNSTAQFMAMPTSPEKQIGQEETQGRAILVTAWRWRKS
jgi:hypothetical protein